MQKLPIGIQTFRDIIEENYIYIDKTKMALDLIEKGKYYFLSRPRRFGKSLFIDTLYNIFEAEKDLFKGLYIYGRYDWSKRYPVIKISFAEGVLHSRDDLDKQIIHILKDNQKLLGVECENSEDIVRCFQTLIASTHEKYKQKVVILVDEYDKPILDNINDIKIANELRDSLRNFYSVIKGSDQYLKFAFLTGVSKFSKVSLFSGLNNLEDITLKSSYSSICGYTQIDVEESFKEYLKEVNMEELQNWYNGYSWLGEKVYNPFDILLFLSNNCEYRNYWFETATPDFLIKLLKEKRYFLPNLENLEVTDSDLGSFEVENLKVETLLFQTGYLTFKGKERVYDDTFYTLSYPNKEVKKSLNEYLFKYFTEINNQSNISFYRALQGDNFKVQEDFLFSLFASIPYNNFTAGKMYEYEGYYSSVMYAYFASLGLEVIAEDTTNKGRIDLTLKFPGNEKVYIFEFKVLESVKDTKKPLDQIKERGYADKYSNVNERYLIGIEFSKKERNIISFEWEAV